MNTTPFLCAGLLLVSPGMAGQADMPHTPGPAPAGEAPLPPTGSEGEPRKPSAEEEAAKPSARASSSRAMVELLKRHLRHQSWEISRAVMEKLALQSPAGSADLREGLLLMARYAASQTWHGESILYYERWRTAVAQAGGENPLLPRVLLELGREYRAAGSTPSAMESFYRAMTVARMMTEVPGTVVRDARWEVAETTYQVGEWERALTLYELFTDTYQSTDLMTQTAFYRMGDCCRALGRENDTVINYERALAHNDRHPFASEGRLGLLEVFLKKDNRVLWQQALSDLAATFPGMRPEEMVYWKRRIGQALLPHVLRSRDYADSLRILDELRKLDASPSWQEQMGRWEGLVYIELGKYDEAVARFSSKPAPAETVGAAATPATAEAATPLAEPDVTVPTARFSELCGWLVDFQRKEGSLYLPNAR